MKKILFIFTLVLMTMFGANAQTTYQVSPDSTAGNIEVYPSIGYIQYDTVAVDTTIAYNFDCDSIVSVDSVYGPHGEFLGVDTTYLCTDTIVTITYDYIEDTLFSEYYIDLRAVAYDGWVFDRWLVTYATNDSVPVLDTMIFYNMDIDTETGDTIYMDGWLENIPVVELSDSTWDSGLQYIDITAYFVPQDTNTNAIQDIAGRTTFTVYPNPTAGIITVSGDIRHVEVFDISGRMVTETNKQVIDLRGQHNGTYIFRMTNTNGHVGITKVIKR